MSKIGTISVVGSRSGAHAGRLLADSDGNGASFVPDRPFAAGETVTVRTHLSIVDARQGQFAFTVAEPAPLAFQPPPATAVPRVPGDVQHFHSLPHIAPEAVRVLRRTGASAPGDIFVAPQGTPEQTGAMILDSDGGLVWFGPVASGQSVDNLQVQRYRGRPVLTWWQGRQSAIGYGLGEGVIYDTSYSQIAVVRAADGLSADLHEFQITPQGSALITAYYPVYVTIAGKRTVVLDCAVQEIDIPTGRLLFAWDSLSHVPVQDSYVAPLDYFHVNAIQQTADGDVLISARNTWAGYLLDHRSGRVIWQLGGKGSSFRMTANARFAFQHDIRLRAPDSVTLFDDGAGPPNVHTASRALTLRLDSGAKSVAVARQFRHAPDVLAQYEGNDQVLPNGDTFVGWGQAPYFTEFDPHGHTVFDARFVNDDASYRAFRVAWRANPAVPPQVAATVGGNRTTVYASWNGSTELRYWQVLAGSTPQTVRPVTTVARQGFETTITVAGAQRYVAVRALDGARHALRASAVVASG